MTWVDRLKEAAYTSPSGARVVFTYENVSSSIEKKTAAFDFPDADGTYVQDLGHTGRRYPLRVIFWGPEYDIAAAAFEALLLERGAGRLEHPLYGAKTVVPFGEIKRRDDLKTASNQAIFEVTFFETVGVVYPTPQDDPAAAVTDAVEAYNEAAAAEFDDATGGESATGLAAIKSQYTRYQDRTRATLRGVADKQDNIRRKFDAVDQSITNSIDTLVRQPLTLARQTEALIQTPARSLAAIGDRLQAYKALARSFTAGGGGQATAGQAAAADFRVKALYAETSVSGSVVSAVNTTFSTRPDAILVAEEVLGQFDELVAWRDEQFDDLALIDTGAAYQQLQEAVSIVAGYLVELSFSLKQERRIILDRARVMVDLMSELYGTIDPELDFFINSNSLTGSEMLELPAGRELVYYV